MIKIITIHQKGEWKWYISNSIQYDFYHTWLYHSIEQSGEPFLLVYHETDDFLAIPLVKRPINGTPFFDLTCVYGYTGPISNKDINELPEDFLENFVSAFEKYLNEQKFVSVFLRLHPLLDQSKLMQRFSGLTPNGKTVAIDLTKSDEEQKRAYRRAYRVDIRKIKEKGYYLKEGKSDKDIQLFREIYLENMRRVDACDSYLFSKEYLSSIIHSTDFDSRLFLVYAGDLPICGAIVSLTNEILEVHLLATRTKYLRESPTKFLIHEVSKFGREKGMKYLHLGGGVGFKEDSLFDWKKGFSDLSFNYYSLRQVVNKEVYAHLLDDRGIDPQEEIDFFPLYRYRSLSLNNS